MKQWAEQHKRYAVAHFPLTENHKDVREVSAYEYINTNL